jgi:hypothetical protein
MGQLQRRAGTDAVEGHFDSRFRRHVEGDDSDDLGVKPAESLREGQSLREPDLANRNQLGVVDGAADDRPSREASPWIYAQDPPGLRQDAASETASSSKDRLA